MDYSKTISHFLHHKRCGYVSFLASPIHQISCKAYIARFGVFFSLVFISFVILVLWLNFKNKHLDWCLNRIGRWRWVDLFVIVVFMLLMQFACKISGETWTVYIKRYCYIFFMDWWCSDCNCTVTVLCIFHIHLSLFSFHFIYLSHYACVFLIFCLQTHRNTHKHVHSLALHCIALRSIGKMNTKFSGLIKIKDETVKLKLNCQSLKHTMRLKFRLNQFVRISRV